MLCSFVYSLLSLNTFACMPFQLFSIRELQPFSYLIWFICPPLADARGGHFKVRYEVMEVPITFPFQKPLADKPNPKQGIGKFYRIDVDLLNVLCFLYRILSDTKYEYKEFSMPYF